MKKLLLTSACLIGLAVSQVANAISFGPSDAVAFFTGSWNDSNASDVASAVGVPVGDVGTLQYKATPPSSESGPLSSSYDTSYTTVGSDIKGFTISYVGGAVADGKYLVAKDGNPHGHYIFDLSGWNGTDPIVVSGLWPNQGNLSHASIWGGKKQVPDGGATAALLGLGMLGLGFLARRKA